MSVLNIEIKAKCKYPNNIRKILINRNAIFKGTDNQKDTYFNVRNGRLKIREGNIENSLVHYDREDISGPKRSDVLYYQPRKEDLVKQQLIKAIGTLVIVNKKREIYYIDNIKFHIDEVEELGSFVEIEAIDKTGNIGSEKLYEQCKEYLALFKIQDEDLINNSYSDMILNKDLKITEGTIKQAVAISKQIPEFIHPYEKDEYEKRLLNKTYLILIALWKNIPAGFTAGYQVDDHFYYWMGGVIPEFREKKIATELAHFQQNWAKEKGFKLIKMKTRNKHIIMLRFALADGFNITGIKTQDDLKENRIFLDKEL
ncbi:MAG: GNAT family N-acetyltransferase [Candidatus Tenebribacter davisii]|nr:GNAT family N-acetyltransferase [Candidatus Tenebribacter davisii]